MRLLILFLLFSTSLFSQTFHKRIDFGFAANRPGGVLPVSNGYIVTGVIGDNETFASGLLVAKLNLIGQVVDVKSHFITPNEIECYRGTITPLNDSILWMSGWTIDPVNYRNGAGIKLDYEGNLLDSFSFNSPYFPEQRNVSPLSFSVENENRFVVSSNIFNYDVGNHVYFTILDSLGNMVIEKVISFPNEDAQFFGSSFTRLGDYYYLFTSKFTRNSPDIEYTQRYLLKMDTLGNTIAENAYPSEPTEGIFLSMGGGNTIPTFDNKIMTTGSRGFEIEGGTYNGNMTYIKVDENLDTIWTREFREPLYEESASNIRRITESPDSSGYVGVGRSYRSFNWHGQISKVSPEGDSLWHRIYHYQDWTDHEHEFWDVEPTADGGYVAVGYSNAQTGGAFQQAYIVKTDEHGCVVPGCHLTDDTTSTVDPVTEIALSLKLYPNPTPDVLNIFFRYADYEKGTFRIIDEQGRIVRTFESTAAEVTHVLALDDLVSGVYFVQYEEAGWVLRTERFVKVE